VCLFVGAVLAIATEATAGFQNQYSDWEPLTEPQKFSYVAGFLDSFIDWRFPDSSAGQVFGRGYGSCLVRQKLTPRILTEVFDNSYKQKVERHLRPRSSGLPGKEAELRIDWVYRHGELRPGPGHAGSMCH